MKKYSKYAQSQPEQSEEVSAPMRARPCACCGWDFNEKHPQKFQKADGTHCTRLLIRTQIALRGFVWCDVCYCRSLIKMGKAQMSGTVVADLHMQALGGSV